MNKNQKHLKEEEEKAPKELSESQFFRHEEAKEVNNMVGNIADDI